MKKVIIRGLTQSVINLNKIGKVLHGAIEMGIEIENLAQEQELLILQRNNLIKIIGNEKSASIVVDEVEQKRVDDKVAQTDVQGGRAVISAAGRVLEAKMKHSVLDDMPESDRTEASIQAMEKLDAEEKEERDLFATAKVDITKEKKLDANEQMGRRAIISAAGSAQQVDLTNSVIPETAAIRESNPFVDLDEGLVSKGKAKGKDKKNNKGNNLFVDNKENVAGKKAVKGKKDQPLIDEEDDDMFVDSPDADDEDDIFLD